MTEDPLRKARLLKDLAQSFSYKLTLGAFLEDKRKGAYQTLVNASHADPRLTEYLMELRVIEHILSYIQSAISEVDRAQMKQAKEAANDGNRNTSNA